MFTILPESPDISWMSRLPHKGYQLSFSQHATYQHFYHQPILGSFCCWGRVRKLFWSLKIQNKNFHFLSITLYHIFNVNPIDGLLILQSINFYFLNMHLTSIFCIDHFYDHFWNFRLYLAILGVGLGQKNIFESQYSDRKLSFSELWPISRFQC